MRRNRRVSRRPKNHHRGPLRYGESLEPRRVLDSTVVFNEIMYHPDDADESLEFIELHNQMAVDMDISQWSLDGGIEFTFPEGATVPGGGYLVLAKDPVALRQATHLDDVTGPFDGRLSNAGERLELRDRNDRLMDWIEYGDGGIWPIAPDGSGGSLAKADLNTASHRAQNWTSSILVGGTPGQRNFPGQREPDTVTSLVPLGDVWKYEASGQDLGTEWREPGFADDSWPGGPQPTLVGYWPLDGNGLATVGDDGLLVGDPTPAPDRNGQADGALSFRGPRRQHVDIPQGGGLDGATSGTISLWVKWNSFQDFDCCGPTYGAVLSRQADRQFSDNILALDSFEPNEAHLVWRQSGGPAPVSITGTSVVGNDTWRHVAVTFSPGQSELFVDGVSQGTGQGEPLHADPDVPLSIGAWIDDGDGFSTSAIDDVAIWDEVLAREQIAALADQTATPLDFAGPRPAPYTASAGGAADAALPLGATTYYFRKEFEIGFDAAPSRTQLLLDTLVDDGAVVYLNGVEVHRTNMPAGAVSSATLATRAVDVAARETGVVLPADRLVVGTNVLAVEVHQSSEADSDLAFDARLTAVTSPPLVQLLDPPPLAINETAAGSADDGWLELLNYGNQPIDLNGYIIETSAGHRRTLDGPMLEPGQFHVLDANPPTFRANTGDRVYVYSPDRTLVVDAARIQDTPQGRIPDGTGAFVRPDGATPGEKNVFTPHDEIVINEIFYHAPANPSSQRVPPTVQETPLLPFDATWRHSIDFNFGANDLPYDPGPNWEDAAHPLSDPKWMEGQGPLGFSTRRTPERINKQFASPQLVSNFITTYYFEAEFGLTQEQIATFDDLQLRHMVDDGAVFYLNGEEVLRFNMPEETPGHQSLAVTEMDTASVQQAFLNVQGLLRAVPETNRLSVEVHQASIDSPDVVFGAELIGRTIVDPGQPPRPYEEDDEEWLELFNRSDHAVDLSGWRVDDAVQFAFAPGTQIAPHTYLVVASDPAALARKYPDIAAQIAGGYTGQLDNQTARVELRDARGNPADVVEYFENGSWPSQADGRGSSLELRDPNAENSSSLAWAPSLESDDQPWKTYSYEGVAGRSSIGPDGEWEEFVLGLLNDGEVLLDDVSVVQDPHGEAIELIQNGSFEDDAIGGAAQAWRIIGNHRHSEVIMDPDDPSNQVLRLVATGATEHMHNHGETTLKNGDDFVQIDRNAEYRISYRAKWISGSNQVNTRLYFGRLPQTTLLERTDTYGTPGRQNSVYVENLGPTYQGLRHWPPVPQPDEPVTVSVDARDADGVSALTLWYSVAGGPWASAPMVVTGEHQYGGQIPGQDAGAIVQFYVEGEDALGSTTEFPREGTGSRALVQVNDDLAETNGLHNLRLILTPDDADFLHRDVELMSNDLLGATVVYDESEVFYNVGIRLSGSERARPFQPRLSFKVGFNAEQLFRGVHSSFILDRSESTGFGQREFIYHHGMNHAGGLPSEYNDLVHIITPRRAHTGSAELQLARVSDVFLDSQFANGSAGGLFEYELTYYPQTTDDGTSEGRKRPQPDGTRGVAITDLGDNKENYRWAFLIKNNRTADDYDRLIEFAKAMGQRGDEFIETIDQFIDVDQWLRAFAFSVITGHGDNYGADGSQHNLQLYIRPSDQRVLQLPHDLDAFFNATRPLVASGDLRKLLAVPGNEHMYYGHVHDMIQTTFNEAYMGPWTEHFGSFLPRQRFDRHLTELVRRSDFLETEILRQAPQVDFALTSEPLVTGSNQATITGTGWIDVREIRLAGSPAPLDVQWTDVTAWQAPVPVSPGTNPVTLQAYDFQGNLVGSGTITVTGTATNPVADAARITELNFNPPPPTPEELASATWLDKEDFEFIELTNTGDATVNLLSARFADGVQFVFPPFELAAGESAVVVSNVEAFRLRYGETIHVVGEYEGHLSNAGEMLKLVDANGQTVQEFAFRNDLYADADARGFSLVTTDPHADLNQTSSWRPSIRRGGSPGAPEPFLLQPGDANRDQVFDQLDIVLSQRGGKYLTGDVATWAEGDWNGDGRFDQRDLVAALQAGRYGEAANLAKRAHPDESMDALDYVYGEAVGENGHDMR